MRLCVYLLAAALVFSFGSVGADAQTVRTKTTSANAPAPALSVAQPSRKKHARTAHRKKRAPAYRQARVNTDGTAVAAWRSTASIASVGPRPKRWCGWWMRTQRGGGPELNVAWNWSKWGRPKHAQVGAVVVWRGHVGEIVGQSANGLWLVRSGNDGGQVRTRARSVRGAVFRI